MPKQVTQADIREVLQHYEDALTSVIAIRKRLDEEGAEVEPGRYFLESDKATDPADKYDTDMSEGLKAWGLKIYLSVPAWVHEEVPECEYQLAVKLPGGLQEPCLLITKKEFEQLRGRLAQISPEI